VQILTFGGSAERYERMFATVRCKRPIFCACKFGERIVACHISSLYLLRGRYVWGYEVECLVAYLLQRGIVWGLSGGSNIDWGAKSEGLTNILVACDFRFWRVSGCTTGSEIRGWSRGEI
jgi:hypothetical protein